MSRVLFLWPGGERVLKEYKRPQPYQLVERAAVQAANEWFGHGQWEWIPDPKWPAIQGPGDALIILTGSKREEVCL